MKLLDSLNMASANNTICTALIISGTFDNHKLLINIALYEGIIEFDSTKLQKIEVFLHEYLPIGRTLNCVQGASTYYRGCLLKISYITALAC